MREQGRQCEGRHDRESRGGTTGMSLDWASLRQVGTTTGPVIFHWRRKGQIEGHSFSPLRVHPRENWNLILRHDFSCDWKWQRQSLQGARDPSRESRQWVVGGEVGATFFRHSELMIVGGPGAGKGLKQTDSVFLFPCSLSFLPTCLRLTLHSFFLGSLNPSRWLSLLTCFPLAVFVPVPFLASKHLSTLSLSLVLLMGVSRWCPASSPEAQMVLCHGCILTWRKRQGISLHLSGIFNQLLSFHLDHEFHADKRLTFILQFSHGHSISAWTLILEQVLVKSWAVSPWKKA